jgi:hypothetical protein
MEPSVPVSSELEKKLLFMAAMGNMPKATGYVVTMGTGHNIILD